MCHVRELIPATQSWEMDGVAEIYKQSDDKVKSDVKSILDGRDSCALWLPLIKSIQGTHGTALHMNEMKELQSEVEDNHLN